MAVALQPGKVQVALLELFHDAQRVKVVVEAVAVGPQQLVQAVVSGEIQLVIDGLTNYVPFVKDGKLRALATLAPGKDVLLPEVARSVRDIETQLEEQEQEAAAASVKDRTLMQ